MSIRISLDNAPDFFTNLDFVSGRVLLGLNRPENVGNIVIKLEGESTTALSAPEFDYDRRRASTPGPGYGDIVTENHKLLYMVQQIYPDERSMGASAMGAMPGLKLPLNNICGDPHAMAKLNGVGGVGGSANQGLLGLGGYRTMDGTKQLMLQHVKSTLPPSLTGFPREAEIRYYIKVTIQRPGFFKENWRYQVGFKFLPIEPPRPPKTTQEAFARRPFAFKPRSPAPYKQKRSFFGSNKTSAENADEGQERPPTIEMSARLPFPSILTCNQPVPLRLIAKKLEPSTAQVYVISLEVALIGFTSVRAHHLQNTEVTRWVVCSESNMQIPAGKPQDPVGSEFVIPDGLWANLPLPNTIAPSFTACNLQRRYELEVKIGLSWGLPNPKGKDVVLYPQMIYLPLKLSKVEIFSGISPPAQLLDSSSYRPQQTAPQPPSLPPRQSGATSSQQQQQPPPPHDALYPPQLGPNDVPGHDDAPPPSYDEAMAQELTCPIERPAYSGVTAENAPSTMPPEKSGLH
ncbi:hypothetical protein PG994_006131 [Apiospora phragmitis]|uniref:Arrestin-like N-terminal domain-containing protein n=1 Tax=Apiospora phragmitis TaxID=2905665 RepID=A0ABR1VGZ1_9PEZI